jgi:hypothetical protein
MQLQLAAASVGVVVLGIVGVSYLNWRQ